MILYTTARIASGTSRASLPVDAAGFASGAALLRRRRPIGRLPEPDLALAAAVAAGRHASGRRRIRTAWNPTDGGHRLRTERAHHARVRRNGRAVLSVQRRRRAGGRDASLVRSERPV